MTFDSPFSAVLLAVWGNLPIARPWSGAGAFFVHKFLCTGWDAVGFRPMRRVSVKSPPSGGDLSAGRRVPVPLCSRWRIENPFSAVIWPPDDGGTRRAQAREGAHGAASGARTARGREADRRDSGDGRARAPRATDFGQRPKDAGGCAPAPAKISAWGRPPEGGEPDEGKGGAPRGRGGGRGTTRRETERPALPHATASAAAIGQASARRQAAGAPEGRKGHAPARHEDARESAASGQADQTDDGEAASGRGSNCPPPRAPETARPRQRTAKRRRGGRRRRRPGGTRTREPAAPLCHQRRTAHRAASAARPTQTEATSTGRRPGARPPGAAARRARNKLPCPAPRAAQGRADGQPGKPPGAKRTGATAQRANLAACAPLWRFFPLVVGSSAFPAQKTRERAKKRKF